MADTTIIFGGLYHLKNDKVSAYICGLDCGDYVVDTHGKIYVPLGSDAGGLLTAAFIVANDGATGADATDLYFDAGGGSAWYTIPAVVGRGFNTTGQLLRPQAEADLKTPTGGSLGKLRRAHQFAVLLVDTQPGPWFGTGFGFLSPLSLRLADGVTPVPETTLYSGVYRATISDTDSFDGGLLWQTLRPGPLTIAAISGYYEASDV